MAASSSLFFLAACDRHGRSPGGEPLIAGQTFESKGGYPCLPYGCGAESFAPSPGAERWLILVPEAGQDFQRTAGGARVYKARIDFDGNREGALAYLRRTSAKNLPHICKDVDAGTAGLAAGGLESTLTADNDAILCAGSRSQLTAKDASVCVAGAKARVQTGRFGVSVAGANGEAGAGDDGLAVTWNGGNAKAGAFGVAVGNGRCRIIVGEHGLAVGSSLCHFQGGSGATFVVRTVDSERKRLSTATAIVGLDGVRPGHWYRFHQGRFEEIEGHERAVA